MNIYLYKGHEPNVTNEDDFGDPVELCELWSIPFHHSNPVHSIVPVHRIQTPICIEAAIERGPLKYMGAYPEHYSKYKMNGPSGAPYIFFILN